MTKLGATGEFPRGRLNPHDEGGLTVAVHQEGGCVRIDFGDPTAWIALPPDDALALAKAIATHAMELKARQ